MEEIIFSLNLGWSLGGSRQDHRAQRGLRHRPRWKRQGSRQRQEHHDCHRIRGHTIPRN